MTSKKGESKEVVEEEDEEDEAEVEGEGLEETDPQEKDVEMVFKKNTRTVTMMESRKEKDEHLEIEEVVLEKEERGEALVEREGALETDRTLVKESLLAVKMKEVVKGGVLETQATQWNSMMMGLEDAVVAEGQGEEQGEEVEEGVSLTGTVEVTEGKIS